MFQAGDLVVYGTTGVCRVESIDQPNMTGADRNKKYYRLKPFYQDGVIYTPVDNTKVSIRPVITREEAEELVKVVCERLGTAVKPVTLVVPTKGCCQTTAVGGPIYDPEIDYSYDNLFHRADGLMYNHKRKIKEQFDI